MGVIPAPMTAPTWLSARQAPTNAAVSTGGSTARMASGISASVSSTASSTEGSSGDLAATNAATVDGSGVETAEDAAEPLPAVAVAMASVVGVVAEENGQAPTDVRLDGATEEGRDGCTAGT